MLDRGRVERAFAGRPDLVAQIEQQADTPDRIGLFNAIAAHILEGHDGAGHDELAHKRRRVDAQPSQPSLPSRPSQGAAQSLEDLAAAETVLLEIRDISFAIPQRKKLDLVVTLHYVYGRASGSAAPVAGCVWAWADVEHVLCVPVPDKAQAQHNYVLLPRGAALASLAKDPKAGPEPLLFSVPTTAPKPGSVTGQAAGLAATVSDSYRTLLHWAIERQLHAVGNRWTTSIVGTDARVFSSAARPSFRPTEKAVHVRAFRGSKDGYLFFLPTGILWAFKKPLLFLPLDRIAAVSYTSVLQRTFNMVVEVELDADTAPSESTTVEVEFGMLDQEDYGGIDETYVRRHGLQDRSMADQRKAKRELAENARNEARDAATAGAGTGTGADTDAVEQAVPDDGLTELQRAEQQLQDDEDELEEDYDPGSGSDSDGSGSDSEDDDEAAGGADDDDDGDDDEAMDE